MGETKPPGGGNLVSWFQAETEMLFFVNFEFKKIKRIKIHQLWMVLLSVPIRFTSLPPEQGSAPVSCRGLGSPWTPAFQGFFDFQQLHPCMWRPSLSSCLLHLLPSPTVCNSIQAVLQAAILDLTHCHYPFPPFSWMKPACMPFYLWTWPKMNRPRVEFQIFKVGFISCGKGFF